MAYGSWLRRLCCGLISLTTSLPTPASLHHVSFPFSSRFCHITARSARSPHHMDDGHVSSERVWSRSTQIDEPRQAISITGHMTAPPTCILLGQHSVAPTQGEEHLSYGVTRRLRAQVRSGLRTMRALPTHYGCEFETVHTSSRAIRAHGLAPTFSSWLESCCSRACMARSGTF